MSRSVSRRGAGRCRRIGNVRGPLGDPIFEPGVAYVRLSGDDNVVVDGDGAERRHSPTFWAFPAPVWLQCLHAEQVVMFASVIEIGKAHQTPFPLDAEKCSFMRIYACLSAHF